MAQGDYYNPYNLPTDEVGTFHWLTIDSKARPSDAVKIFPDYQYPDKPPQPPPKREKTLPEKQAKLSPELAKLVSEGKAKQQVDVNVILKDNTQIPLLPPLQNGESRDGKRPTLRSVIVSKLRDERKADQIERLKSMPIEIKAHYWLVNSVKARTDVDGIKQLAECDDVSYVERAKKLSKAPSGPDSSTVNNPETSRREMQTDPYATIPRPSGEWLGLMDSGVNRDHDLLCDPDRIVWWLDIVHSDNGWDNGSADFQPDDLINHGTGTAAIIAGNDNMGSSHRGLTDVHIDSWRVYWDDGDPICNDSGGCPDDERVIRAIELGVERGFEDYILVMTQFDLPANSNLTKAADAAFDAGVVVLAPVGNFGPGSGSVRAPANGHKVIGIGAYNISTIRTYGNQGRGPTDHDYRIKPDIQAPTQTETASGTGPDHLHVYPSTSGASGYAAGVAVLCSRWLNLTGMHDKGLVYAYMILYGRDGVPLGNELGAGWLRMILNAGVGHGRLHVAHGQSVVLPIDVDEAREHFDVAIWWPEACEDEHSEIHLYVYSPNGSLAAGSSHSTSVFQKAQIPGPLAPGRWQIIIHGSDIPAEAQNLYLAVSVGYAT